MMASSSSSPEVTAMAMEEAVTPQPMQEPWEYILRKYILMLATLVATVTYGVGFNPPGGVWQENGGPAGHRAGEPILRSINNLRYLVFFYCNAFALASSVLVIVLFLLLSIDLIEKKKKLWIKIRPLRVLMLLDLLSFMGAYTAGSCHDMFTTVYTLVLMSAGVSTYLAVQVLLACRPDENTNHGADLDLKLEGRQRKVLMLLATFAMSITYVAGLNSPGGFWDNTGTGHRLGDAILNDSHHKARLASFFVCNTTAFTASLLIIILLLGRKLHEQTVWSLEIYGCILVTPAGLVGAYATGSCREAGATTFVPLLVVTSLVCILILSWFWPQLASDDIGVLVSTKMVPNFPGMPESDQSRSLLLLLATFATAITYQAGLDPPGGVWQENGTDHLAGDPILLTMNASRYRTFLYCNSFAFMCSAFSIISGSWRFVRMVESVMILELVAFIGAFAAGASRDVRNSIYVMAFGGAILFYVVTHVIFFKLEQDGVDSSVEQAELEKKRKLLYLLATLSTAMSYQAGLTPPGGFWLQDDNESGHQAGHPVLLNNHPRRYKAFFYCNSVSFMLSITTMIILVRPVLYRPAIRSHALTLCTVVGLSCLMGAYAAGSSQHPTTSISMFVLVPVAILILLVLLLKFLVKDKDTRLGSTATLTRAEAHEQSLNDQEFYFLYSVRRDKIEHAYGKLRVLLGILMAGITYQAGLDPPGGVWQSDAGGHDAGNPAMKDNRRLQYLVFFYSNSTSFAVSIFIIVLLVLWRLKKKKWFYLKVVQRVLMLDLVSLVVAYVAGSSRDRKSFIIITALAIPIPTMVALHVCARYLLPPI